MPTGFQDTSKIDAITRDVYHDRHRIWAQYYQNAPTLDLLDQGRMLATIAKHEGKRIYVPCEIGENPNLAVPVGENGPYPVEGGNSYDKLVFNASKFVGVLGLTDTAMDSATGGDQSFGNIIALEMRSIAKNTRRRENRYTYLDGSSQLGTLPASGAWTTATKKFKVAASDMQNFRVGMELGLYELAPSSGGPNKPHGTWANPTTAPFVVAALDTSANTVEVVAALGLTSDIADLSAYGLFLWRTAQGENLIGFGIICSDADPTNWGGTGASFALGGALRSSNTWWKGKVLDATATPSAVFNIEDHVLEIQRQIRQETGEDPDLCFVEDRSWNRIRNEMRQDGRFDSQVTMLKQKYRTIEIEGTKFVRDRDCPTTDAFFITKADLYRYNWIPWQWEQRDGRIWNRATDAGTGRAIGSYRAYFATRKQLIPFACRGMGRVKNLAA